MAGNANLGAAKNAKKDEFYTQLSDIEKELRHYSKHFNGKTVLCNCDDPFESNFFKYFVLNFNRLGLKKLIATCYTNSPIANQQLSIFDVLERTEENKNKPYKAIVTTVYDKTGNGGVDMLDVAELFKSGENELTELDGDGDFRSPECLALLSEADIVATNPPFSLFREYVAVLMQYKKKFIIIGNVNTISCKESFHYLINNKMWLGFGGNYTMTFRMPDYYELKSSAFIGEDGHKYIKMRSCAWYTNLDIKQRHEEMILVKRYKPEDYPKYDNYDAIEVSKTADIPCDYAGVMGVPITFLDKYNPDQFEILGLSQKVGLGLQSKKLYDSFREIRQDGTFTGSSGKKTNGNPMLSGKPKKGNYYINNAGDCAYSLYGRIFIRNKHPEAPKER